MSNILSIDFNYIMYPCIKLYNSMCVEKENSTVIWKNIESALEIDKFLCYDTDSLRAIAKIIKSNVESGAEFIPIQEHNEIIKHLENKLDEIDALDVFNIDFYHDIYYHEEDFTNIKYFGACDSHSWVGNLIYNEKFGDILKSYRWLKAPNSSIFPGELPERVSFEMLMRKDLNNVANEFNTVFLCLSPQVVPYKYHHLYDLLVDMFKED